MAEETMMEKYMRYKRQLVDASIEMNCASAAEALNFFKDDEYYDDDMNFTYDYILSEIVYYYILGYERHYSMVRNMPAGRKPADIAFIPINFDDVPLLIVDVGLDSSADAHL